MEDLEDNEVTENDLTPKSNFEYFRIAKQTRQQVVLEWKYLSNEEEKEVIESPKEKVFKIVKLKCRDEWETISWSRKSCCVIKNLEQNTCYSIKVLVMVQTFERFEVVDSSEILKVK